MAKNSLPAPQYQPDPAAIFGAAVSIHDFCVEKEKSGKLDLSEAYQGFDQFMRSAMNVANKFESWACKNLNFDNLVECWPYQVQHSFAKSLFSVVKVTELEKVDDAVFEKVGKVMELPLMNEPEVKASRPAPLSSENLSKKLSRATKRRRAASIELE